MPVSEPVALLLILLGPAVGSFLALLADRLGRGEDIVVRGSACRTCGTGLGLRDLVPLISFMATRGRCRHCGVAIPPKLLYVEIIAAGVGLCAVLAGGGSLNMILSALFLWLLLGLTLTDLQWFRLPDMLSAALAVVAFALALLPGGIGLAMACLGAGLGAGSFLALRLGYRALRGRDGLGLGDVKLMAPLGAFAGPLDLPLLVLMAALAGLACGAALHLRAPGGTGGDTGDKLALRMIPFGAALCGAAALLWLLRAAQLLN